VLGILSVGANAWGVDVNLSIVSADVTVAIGYFASVLASLLGAMVIAWDMFFLTNASANTSGCQCQFVHCFTLCIGHQWQSAGCNCNLTHPAAFSS
jgi:hypothetical protein